VRLLVVGAGAVGSWLGGSAAAGGAEVVFSEPGPRRTEIAARGLVLRPPGREVHVRAGTAPTVAEAMSVASGPFDAALVAVKHLHTDAVAAELAACRWCGAVVSVQNGVGNEARLRANLPGCDIVPASMTTAVQVADDGSVVASAKGGLGLALSGGRPRATESEADGSGATGDQEPRTVTASSDRSDHGAVDDLARHLAAAGIVVRRYGDGRSMKWSKLLLNILGSATSAILRWPPSRVFADRRLFEVERRAWIEALDVIAGLGLAPVALPGFPVPLYAGLVRRVPPALQFRLFASRLAGARADRLPGPAAELAAGHGRTEIEVLGGAVADAGAAVGVPTPVNAVLSRLVSDIAAGRVTREAFEGRPAALLAAVRGVAPAGQDREGA